MLGVLIARVSGQPFESFLKERIFDPLGMRDTAFCVPAAKLGRFTSSYAANPQSGALELIDDSQESKWSRAPVFPAGGAGLVSTIDDYCAFGRMMINEGKLASERILARPTVELMLTDQITPAQKAVSPFSPGFWVGRGWGLGLSVITGRETTGMSPGQFGWSGAFGTDWVSDSVEDLVSILMIQRMNMGPTRIHEDFARWPTRVSMTERESKWRRNVPAHDTQAESHAKSDPDLGVLRSADVPTALRTLLRHSDYPTRRHSRTAERPA